MTHIAKSLFLCAFFTASITTSVASAQIEIQRESITTLAEAVGVKRSDQYLFDYKLPKLKIAIIDQGFKGYSAAKGKTIPHATRLRMAPKVEVDEKTEDIHGLKMAEIVAGILERAEAPYQLHLFYAKGYSNFEWSVNTVVAEKFDLVLYAQVWEYGGNDDGRGFINTLVNKATSAGITWVNAASNFEGRTYRSGIRKGPDDWATLPGSNSAVHIRCLDREGKVTVDFCLVRLVLSWNSFADQVGTGTDKDLDLVLTDDTMKIIETAALEQTAGAADRPGLSQYPREILEAKVKPGLYFARVKVRSNNFTPQDKMRLTLSGDHSEMIHSTRGESVFNPADNATVITVGDSESDRSSVSASLNKPDIKAPSLLKTEVGLDFRGSSNSSAAVFSRLVIEKILNPRSTRQDLLAIATGRQASGVSTRVVTAPPVVTAPQGGSSIGSPTGNGCYELAVNRDFSDDTLAMLRQGAWVVQTTNGPRALLNEDPQARANRLGLRLSNPGYYARAPQDLRICQ